tara:strand:- start:4 stop:486 length:483 start_codon:yes stop_codon:yes gene_type:complete
MFLAYQLDSKEKENFSYSPNIRETSFAASFWVDEAFNSSVFESNDVIRDRRIAAYSNHISLRDSSELSSGLVNMSDMKVERISVVEMYLNASDHLWKWDDSSSVIYEKRTFSVVNLAMSSASGQSSKGYAVLDYHYKNMPDFSYRIYSNSELAVYWTYNY